MFLPTMQRQFARMEVSFDFGATDSTFTTGDLGSEPLPLDDAAPGGTLVDRSEGTLILESRSWDLGQA